MKELDGFGDAIFDEHALGIAGDHSRRGPSQMVGQQDGRLFVTEFSEGELAQGTLVMFQENPLVQDFGGAKGPSQAG